MKTVIRVLNDKDGKDKSIKLIQYFAKLVLHTGYGNQSVAKLQSSLSLFRALMRLGNWIEAGHNLSMGAVKGRELVVEALDFYTAIFDDVICAKKMGLISSKRLTHVADRQAAISWFLAIMFNIQTAYRKYDKSPTTINAVGFWKLACDGVFCAVDVFELPWDLLQILAGLMSGILGYYKIYYKFGIQ